ncbi:MAG: hypothetical protein KDB07_09640, partial [Planctomycetes bacterium]|nr:hypothetical protein [Planctomycetota bacterium]
MGLFTRTVLLLALIYLSVTFGVGIAKLNDGAPSDVDRLVRARYERHRIAARAAFVDGGEVTNPTVSSYVPAGSGGAAHDSAVGQFNKPGHPADASALSSVNFVLVDQVTKKNDELKASKLKSADTERQEVADLAASVSRKLISFNANTAHMRRFALEVRPFVNGLSDSAMYLIQTQESLQILAQEERDLLMAEQSLINQKSRIEESMAALEDEIDSTQREHVRVAELVARYTSVNPSIAKDLTAAGTPWVDGRVIWAGQ